jgi:hypothetical protein
MSPQSEWVDLDIDRAHPKSDFGLSWNSSFEVKARIDRAHKIWYGEMRIPMSSLPPLWPKPGDTFRLGLYRIEGPPPNRKYGSWQPLYRATYHTRSRLERLYSTRNSPRKRGVSLARDVRPVHSFASARRTTAGSFAMTVR